MPDTTESTTAKPADAAATATGSPSQAGTVAPADSAAAKPEPTAREKLSAFARQERERMAEKRAYEQRIYDAETRAQEAERKAQQQAEAIELARRDPYKFLGKSARELAEDVIREGTPEAKEAAIQAEIRAEREARERLEKELRDRDAAGQAERNRQQALRQLHTAWDAVKERCPALAKAVGEDEDALVEEYLIVYEKALKDPDTRDYAKAGRYTDEEYLHAANERIAKRYLRDGAISPSVNGDASSGHSASQAGSSARTLTNGAAAEKASSWKPANFERLPEQEQNRLLAEALDKGLLR